MWIARRSSTFWRPTRPRRSAIAPSAVIPVASRRSAGRSPTALLAGGVLPGDEAHAGPRPGHRRQPSRPAGGRRRPRDARRAPTSSPFVALADLPMAMTAHVVYQRRGRRPAGDRLTGRDPRYHPQTNRFRRPAGERRRVDACTFWGLLLDERPQFYRWLRSRASLQWPDRGDAAKSPVRRPLSPAIRGSGPPARLQRPARHRLPSTAMQAASRISRACWRASAGRQRVDTGHRHAGQRTAIRRRFGQRTLSADRATTRAGAGRRRRRLRGAARPAADRWPAPRRSTSPASRSWRSPSNTSPTSSRCGSLRLELAADYLVMAAWLAYLKSRLLLPEEKDGEEPTGEELAAELAFRLRRLEAMRDAAARLANRNRLGRDVFARGQPEPVEIVQAQRILRHALRPAHRLCDAAAGTRDRPRSRRARARYGRFRTPARR